LIELIVQCEGITAEVVEVVEFGFRQAEMAPVADSGEIGP
jgi:hypothetical protein